MEARPIAGVDQRLPSLEAPHADAFKTRDLSSLQERRVTLWARSPFGPPPEEKRDLDSALYNVKGRALGVLIYSISSVADACFYVVEKISEDTNQLNNVLNVEKALLETHFSELNVDAEHAAQSMKALAQYIPFVHGPISLLVDAVERVNRRNLNLIEKCSKVTWQVFSFIPKLGAKGIHKTVQVIRTGIRYPKWAGYQLIQNPDRLDSCISQIFRVCSCRRKSKKGLPVPRVEGEYHPVSFPQYVAWKSPPSSESASGKVAKKVCSALGHAVSSPFFLLTRPGRFDLKLLTTATLKAAEIYCSSDQGARLITAIAGRVIPIEELEGALEKVNDLIIRVPEQAARGLSTLQEHMRAVQAEEKAEREFIHITRDAISSMTLLGSEVSKACETNNTAIKFCLPATRRLLDTSLSRLNDTAGNAASLENDLRLIQQAVSVPWYKPVLDSESRRLHALLKKAVNNGTNVVHAVQALSSAAKLKVSSPIVHRVAITVQKISEKAFSVLKLPCVTNFLSKITPLVTAYGAKLCKLSFIGYDASAKLTRARKNLILSTQKIASDTLTNADVYLQKTKGTAWSHTISLLKFAVPLGITLATNSGTPLTTRLFQVLIPYYITQIDPEFLRKGFLYFGGWLKNMFDSLGDVAKEKMNSFHEGVQTLIHSPKLTAEVFQSLPPILQRRIQSLVRDKSSPETIVKGFNELPKREKQKVHLMGEDEFQALSDNEKTDMFVILATSSQKDKLKGDNPKEKFDFCQRISRKNPSRLLELYSALRPSDFCCLVPSQAEHLSDEKQRHLRSIIHKYGSPFCATTTFLNLSLLFSSLPISEKEEFSKLSSNELSLMTKEDLSLFFSTLHAHLQEWSQTGRMHLIFSFFDEEKIDQCLNRLSPLLHRLIDPTPKPISEEELEEVRLLFNQTSPLFRSNLRMHLELYRGHLSQNQITEIQKEITAIDTLFIENRTNQLKVIMSSNHFKVQAAKAQKELQERTAQKTLTLEKKVELEHIISSNEEAKKARLRELAEYRLILTHLKYERNDRDAVLKIQHVEPPPHPKLTDQEVQGIFQSFH